jgi:hypothetical protein
MVRKHYKDAVARKFNRLDFHDDILKLVTIHPSSTARNLTSIDFEVEDHSTRTTKLLSFHSCANVRFSMDFDVLASNWFANTEGSAADTNAQKMRKFIAAQKPHWRTTYMPPQPKDRPIRKKLSSIRDYALFKVKFFGGTVEILAKNFKLK